MDDKFSKLSARIVKEMKRLRVPGAALGIWHKGSEYTAGFGVTSIEHPLPVTPDTLFQVGSISKTFTASLMMKLVEQGLVDLDAPVKKYIPGFELHDKTVGRRVTVRQLLTHMGGWVGDYFNDFGNGDDALAKMVRDIASLPQIQPLGKIWSYNNTGFNIAARIIEVLTGRSYEQAVQEMLFDPLKLKMSFFYPSDILFTHRFVVGHAIVRNKVLVSRPWAIGRAGNGVGGVVSTVKDLLAFGRFHMGGGRGILKKSSLEAMRVKQVNAGLRGDMGITWFMREIGGIQFFGHGGATNGQQAYFCFIPGQDFALAILTNSDEGGMLATKTLTWALDLYFNVKSQSPKPVEMPDSKLKEVSGRYQIGTECFDLKLRGKYVMFHHIPLGGFPTPASPPGPAMPPMRFLFFDADKMIALDEPLKGAVGDFIRAENGQIEYFRIGARAHKKIS